MRYGDIIRSEEGYLCKITGTCIKKNKKYYILKPLVEEVTVPREYIEKCELVKENPFGIELEFEL